MCVEKIGIRGRRSFEMLVCMMLRSRVRLRLLCGLYVFAANARMCVAEARSPWSHLGRYMSVVSGAIPRDCTHTCVLYKQGARCYDLLRGCVGKYSSVAKC